MKITLTEQQLDNLLRSTSIDFEKIAPNMAKFGSKIMKGRKKMDDEDDTTTSKLETSTENKSKPDSKKSPTIEKISKPDEKKYTPALPSHKLDIVNPVSGNNRISIGFGWRTHPVYKKKDFHSAVDISVPSGTQILSPMDGVVLDSRNAGGRCGGFIRIQHDKYITKYCHIRELLVKKGEKVKKGDVIGITGGGKNDPMRGTSTGPHLHYGVLNLQGKALDPLTIHPNLGYYGKKG